MPVVTAFVDIRVRVVITTDSRVGCVRAVRTGVVCAFTVREAAVALSVVRSITARDVRTAVPVLRVGAATRVGRGFLVFSALPVVVFHVVLVRVSATTVSLVGLARVERTGATADLVVRVGTSVRRVAAVDVRDVRSGSVVVVVVDVVVVVVEAVVVVVVDVVVVVVEAVVVVVVDVVVGLRVGAGTRVGRLV